MWAFKPATNPNSFSYDIRLNSHDLLEPQTLYDVRPASKPKLGFRPTWILIMGLTNHQPSILHIQTFMDFLLHMSKQSSIKFGNKFHSMSTNKSEILQ